MRPALGYQKSALSNGGTPRRTVTPGKSRFSARAARLMRLCCQLHFGRISRRSVARLKTIHRPFPLGKAAGTWTGHRYYGSSSRRHDGPRSRGRCHRTGFVMLTPATPWTGVPGFISSALRWLTPALRLPGGTFTPSPSRVRQSFWRSEVHRTGNKGTYNRLRWKASPELSVSVGAVPVRRSRSAAGGAQ